MVQKEKRKTLHHKVTHNVAYIILITFIFVFIYTLIFNTERLDEIPNYFISMVSMVVGFYFARYM